MRLVLVTATVISLAFAGLAQAGEQAAPKSSKYTAEQIKKAKPTATVELDAAQFGLLVGGATGKGTLTYQGKAYPFTIKAASAGSVGVSKVHATGNVYFLERAEDFAGTYTAVAASGAFVKGVGASQYENTKGVFIDLRTKSEGVAASFGLTAVTVELAK